MLGGGACCEGRHVGGTYQGTQGVQSGTGSVARGAGMGTYTQKAAGAGGASQSGAFGSMTMYTSCRHRPKLGGLVAHWAAET